MSFSEFLIALVEVADCGSFDSNGNQIKSKVDLLLGQMKHVALDNAKIDPADYSPITGSPAVWGVLLPINKSKRVSVNLAKTAKSDTSILSNNGCYTIASSVPLSNSALVVALETIENIMYNVIGTHLLLSTNNVDKEGNYSDQSEHPSTKSLREGSSNLRRLHRDAVPVRVQVAFGVTTKVPVGSPVRPTPKTDRNKNESQSSSYNYEISKQISRSFPLDLRFVAKIASNWILNLVDDVIAGEAQQKLSEIYEIDESKFGCSRYKLIEGCFPIGCISNADIVEPPEGIKLIYSPLRVAEKAQTRRIREERQGKEARRHLEKERRDRDAEVKQRLQEQRLARRKAKKLREGEVNKKQLEEEKLETKRRYIVKKKREEEKARIKDWLIQKEVEKQDIQKKEELELEAKMEAERLQILSYQEKKAKKAKLVKSQTKDTDKVNLLKNNRSGTSSGSGSNSTVKKPWNAPDSNLKAAKLKLNISMQYDNLTPQVPSTRRMMSSTSIKRLQSSTSKQRLKRDVEVSPVKTRSTKTSRELKKIEVKSSSIHISAESERNIPELLNELNSESGGSRENNVDDKAASIEKPTATVANDEKAVVLKSSVDNNSLTDNSSSVGDIEASVVETKLKVTPLLIEGKADVIKSEEANNVLKSVETTPAVGEAEMKFEENKIVTEQTKNNLEEIDGREKYLVPDDDKSGDKKSERKPEMSEPSLTTDDKKVANDESNSATITNTTKAKGLEEKPEVPEAPPRAVEKNVADEVSNSSTSSSTSRSGTTEGKIKTDEDSIVDKRTPE